MAWCRIHVLLQLLLLTGCATQPPLLAPLLSSEPPISDVELVATPFHPQQQYQCGPAALATMLGHSGVSVSIESLLPLVYLPEKKGSLQLEIVAASRRYDRIPYVIRPELETLMAELQAGRPVMVLMNIGLDLLPVWHYAVVIGYSAQKDEVILRSGVTRRETLSAHRFVDAWERSGRWAMVLLKPGDLPTRADQLNYLKAVAAMENLAPADSLIAAYRAALRQWPESATALFGLAAMQHHKGMLPEAELNYRKLLRANPEHIPAQNNLAEVLADRGCYREAATIIGQALQNDTGELHQHLLETARDIEKRESDRPSLPSSCRKSENRPNNR